MTTADTSTSTSTSSPAAGDVTTEERALEGPHGPLRVRLYRPAKATGPGLLWLHGGGFSGGDLDMPEADWVSRSFAEHGIFRLGDAVASGVPQIWEQLESEHGVTAGAVSPMNAANRLRDAAFFVPDPWTPTMPAGSWLLRKLSNAVSQVVNDNAASRITAESLFFLLLGVLRYARLVNYPAYLKLVLGVLRRPWNKVRFLDLFLSDVFVDLTRAKRPGFCTLFVNGAAHLQHHYLLNSPMVADSGTSVASRRIRRRAVSALAQPMSRALRIAVPRKWKRQVEKE